MGQAVSALQSCLASGELLETDVTPDLLQQCLYTRVGNLANPQILIKEPAI